MFSAVCYTGSSFCTAAWALITLEGSSLPFSIRKIDTLPFGRTIINKSQRQHHQLGAPLCAASELSEFPTRCGPTANPVHLAPPVFLFCMANPDKRYKYVSILILSLQHRLQVAYAKSTTNYLQLSHLLA